MKKMVLLIMALTLMLSLTACGCSHETWKVADCVTPKTCVDCGETEGEALGHTWKDADCENPKTCETCGETEGEALGHSWVDADCENPKTCSVCNLTEGEALGHEWQDATTETPKTCSVCEKTEGERIITDERFTTANNQQLFGKWATEISEYVPEFDMDMEMSVFMEFHPDGTMNLGAELKDPDAFRELMIEISVESTYEGMAAEGYDREEADAAFQEAYGMTVEEYITEVMSTMDMNEVLGMVDAVTYVYYAEGDQLYMGMSWKMEMTGQQFSVEDGVLYVFEGGVEPTAYHRVEE